MFALSCFWSFVQYPTFPGNVCEDAITVSGKRFGDVIGSDGYGHYDIVEFFLQTLSPNLAVCIGISVIDVIVQAIMARNEGSCIGGGCLFVRASPFAAFSASFTCFPLSTERRHMARLFYVSVAYYAKIGAKGLTYVVDKDYQFPENGYEPYQKWGALGYQCAPFPSAQMMMVKEDGTYLYISFTGWCALIYVPMVLKIVLFYTVLNKIKKSSDAIPHTGHGMTYLKVGLTSKMLM